MALKARAYGDFDAVENSDASALRDFDPSQTVQSDRDDADINVLIERFGLGEVMASGVPMPSLLDYADVSDFQSAMNAIVKGREAFAQMPPKVRSRFDNDPQKFLEFCEDPGNREEALALGLVERKAEPVKAPPLEVRVIADPVASPAPK